MLPNYQRRIVYLSDEQRQELFTNGSITVGGQTIVYSDNDLYVTPQEEPYVKPAGGIPAADLAPGVIPSAPVQDVQVGETSVVSNGVANIPLAGRDTLGVVALTHDSYGIVITPSNQLKLNPATSADIKTANQNYKPIAPNLQHESAFYGLTKAAGVDLANDANITVGTYPDSSKSAIQQMLGVASELAPVETDYSADNAYAIGDVFFYNGKLCKATAAIAVNDTIAVGDTAGCNCVETSVAEFAVKDVQVDGTSVVTNGVANVLTAGNNINDAGVIWTTGTWGLTIYPRNHSYRGAIAINLATSANIKNGVSGSNPLSANTQHESTFYGLAKAAGHDEKDSTETVGTYTPQAKSAIQSMLGVEPGVCFVETVSGTTPSITGEANVRYMCGTVTEISITPPATGTIDVIFTSGSTPAILTLPSTVKFPEWVDIITLEADTVYEIMITDGVYGGVMTWQG